jgi:hypothetical protein
MFYAMNLHGLHQCKVEGANKEIQVFDETLFGLCSAG